MKLRATKRLPTSPSAATGTTDPATAAADVKSTSSAAVTTTASPIRTPSCDVRTTTQANSSDIYVAVGTASTATVGASLHAWTSSSPLHNNNNNINTNNSHLPCAPNAQTTVSYEKQRCSRLMTSLCYLCTTLRYYCPRRLRRAAHHDDDDDNDEDVVNDHAAVSSERGAAAFAASSSAPSHRNAHRRRGRCPAVLKPVSFLLSVLRISPAGPLRRRWSARHARSLLYLILLLALATIVSDAALGVVVRSMDWDVRRGAAAASGSQSSALFENGERFRWLTCDCLGERVVGSLADLTEANRSIVSQQFATLQAMLEPSCTVCASVLRDSVQRKDKNDDDDPLLPFLVEEGSALHHRENTPFFVTLCWQILSLPLDLLGRLWRAVWASLGWLGHVALPNTTSLLRVAAAWYDAYAEATEARLLQELQNRGVTGNAHPASPPSIVTFLSALLHGAFSDTAAQLFVQGNIYLVEDGQQEAQRACQERSPLMRVGVGRAMLPWLRIDSGQFRTRQAWSVDPQGRQSALPFSVPATAAERDALKASLLQSGKLQESEITKNGVRPQTEITVAVTATVGGFRSYFCADMPNVSTTRTYFLDPLRPPVNEFSHAVEATTGEKETATVPAGPNVTRTQCKGCTFQCIHPRLIRRWQKRAARAQNEEPYFQQHQHQHQQQQHHHQQQQQQQRTGGVLFHNVEGVDAASVDDVSGEVAEMISWDVHLEDVDAGRIRLPITVPGETTTTAEHVVTRHDLFSCKVLNPFHRDAAERHNADLLLATDVWLSHFSGALPMFYTHHHSSSLAQDTQHNTTHEAKTTSQTLPYPLPQGSLPVRLLPLHTAAVYGESFQSFPDYALRQAHWSQFDSVFLPHALRQPSRLLSPTSTKVFEHRSKKKKPIPAAAAPPRSSTSTTAATATTTQYAAWTIVHLYLREFQLVVHFNQQLRQLRERRAALGMARPSSLQLDDLPGAMTNATWGVLPRLAREVLAGADPLMLPMRRENLYVPATHAVRWRPPDAAAWSSGPFSKKPTPSLQPKPAAFAAAFAAAAEALRGEKKDGEQDEAAGEEEDKSLLPFSPEGRLPVIVAAISNCWHGRMWWLSELSRYYPVHNYGRCAIPTPIPMPGDAPVHPDIPQRAQYPFPMDCHPRKLIDHHTSALQRLQKNQNASSAEGRPRPLTHLSRDHELRCVFRRYKYVLSFENSIEDDYVTEKIYNGLLSGALTLYIGAMNIDQYVPRSVRRDASARASSTFPAAYPNEKKNATTSTTAAAAGGEKRSATSSIETTSFGLSVLPILQMFPILNETAARLEDRRIRILHEVDEAATRHVMHTHASVLRMRAAATARASAKSAKAAAAAPEGSVVSPTGRTGKASDAENHLILPSAAATMAEVVAEAMDVVARQASQHTQTSHYLLYNTTPLTPRGPASKLQEHRYDDTTKDQHHTNNTNDGVGVVNQPSSLFATPLGSWPPPTQQNTSQPTSEEVHHGFSSFLTMVHRSLATAPQPTDTPATPSNGISKHRKYAVRTRADREFALTANTAFAVAEALKQHSTLPTTTTMNTAAAAAAAPNNNAPSARGAPSKAFYFPEPVGSFSKNEHDAAANVSDELTGAVRYVAGTAFSKYFVRRAVPVAPTFDKVVREKRAQGQPMSGFAQLAAYLRALDADPKLVDEAGYFDWWKAESMTDFGDAFLAKLHVPHPICSICAAALEKKEALSR